jgi:hypothetical protein
MAASLIIVGRTFPLDVYLIWGILCVPGILYIVAASLMRGGTEDVPVMSAR